MDIKKIELVFENGESVGTTLDNSIVTCWDVGFSDHYFDNTEIHKNLLRSGSILIKNADKLYSVNRWDENWTPQERIFNNDITSLLLCNEKGKKLIEYVVDYEEGISEGDEFIENKRQRVYDSQEQILIEWGDPDTSNRK